MLELYKKSILWLVVILSVSIIFKSNCIDSFNRVNDFQYDSEDLAIGAIAAQHYHVKSGWQGLGRLLAPGYKWGSERIYLENRQSNKGLSYSKYSSQIGLQGLVYSKIGSYVYSKTLINTFRNINCFFLSIILVFLLYLLKVKYGNLFAVIWGCGFIFSPWIVNFAPNLYWVEFTWFIPMLIGLIAVSEIIVFKYKNWILTLLLFISVSIKSACGYEYLSTILIGMILFPLTELLMAYFVRKDHDKVRNCIKVLVSFSISAVLAFCFIISVHGYLRGNGNIFLGVKSIYQQDVLRRTSLGNQYNFTNSNIKTMESINTTIGFVLNKYFDFYSNKYQSNIVLGLDGRYFKAMSVLAICLLLLRYRKSNYLLIFKDEHFYILLISLISTLSWLVLAKSHSYIHVHMNYVLWYFGYVQICLFIIVHDSLWHLKNYCKN